MNETKSVVRSRVALPEQDYLARIGELAYSVSYLEWTLLGDLHRLADHLPAELALADLEWRTTGGIAGHVKKYAVVMPEGPVKDYVNAAADAFKALAPLRNNLLHARPCTDPSGRQRLLRAETEGQKTTGRQFMIDERWFNEAMTVLNEHSAALHALRPSFSDFPA